MAATTVLPNRQYAKGTYTFAPAVVPIGTVKATLKLTREAWPIVGPVTPEKPEGQDIVSFRVDMSFDGGLTWLVPWAAFTAVGGDIGETESFITVALVRTSEDALSAIRQIRGTVILADDVRTTGTVELT